MLPSFLAVGFGEKPPLALAEVLPNLGPRTARPPILLSGP